MKKYESFLELTQAFAEREGTALLYTDEDGDICSVSYRELAEMIMMRTELARQRGPGTSIIYAAPDPDTIARIFATVMGGRCVMLSGWSGPCTVVFRQVNGEWTFADLLKIEDYSEIPAIMPRNIEKKFLNGQYDADGLERMLNAGQVSS